ncbi:MAG TPA: hypothetical protein VFC84_20670 [Desulfosporosinus sp.]|nr:hypothetical protein [Desulfosporosinus sp.]
MKSNLTNIQRQKIQSLREISINRLSKKISVMPNKDFLYDEDHKNLYKENSEAAIHFVHETHSNRSEN